MFGEGAVDAGALCHAAWGAGYGCTASAVGWDHKTGTGRLVAGTVGGVYEAGGGDGGVVGGVGVVDALADGTVTGWGGGALGAFAFFDFPEELGAGGEVFVSPVELVGIFLGEGVVDTGAGDEFFGTANTGAAEEC